MRLIDETDSHGGTDKMVSDRAENHGRAVVGRVLGLLFSPGSTWRAIKDDDVPVMQIWRTSVVPLSAIFPVSGFLARVTGAINPSGLYYPVGTSLLYAIMQWLFLAAIPFLIFPIVLLVVKLLGGEIKGHNAFKISAYAITPTYISGIGTLSYSLDWILFLNLYTFVLMGFGLSNLMNVKGLKTVAGSMGIIVAALFLAKYPASALGSIVPRPSEEKYGATWLSSPTASGAGEETTGQTKANRFLTWFGEEAARKDRRDEAERAQNGGLTDQELMEEAIERKYRLCLDTGVGSMGGECYKQASLPEWEYK